MRKRERKEKSCKNCNKPIVNANTYCDHKCQTIFQRKKYISEWKKGLHDGIRSKKTLLVSKHIMNYLRERSNNSCESCGWNEINPYTNRVPIEIDHIDGDASNNKEENLRMLCPNCHSLTPTFRNTGNRKSKRIR